MNSVYGRSPEDIDRNKQVVDELIQKYSKKSGDDQQATVKPSDPKAIVMAKVIKWIPTPDGKTPGQTPTGYGTPIETPGETPDGNQKTPNDVAHTKRTSFSLTARTSSYTSNGEEVVLLESQDGERSQAAIVYTTVRNACRSVFERVFPPKD